MAGINFPILDFSTLGDLPQTFRETQERQARKDALQGLDTEGSYEELAKRASQLISLGDPESIKLGTGLHELASKKRSQALEESTTRYLTSQGGEGYPSVGPSVDPRNLVPFIRERAAAYGIDPEKAVKVAAAEGLSNPLGDIQEGKPRSFGAFQLYTRGGLGNDFQRDTKLDPSDPANERATIDYALKRASQEGWGPWMGAKKLGFSQFEGINRGGAGGPAVAQAGPVPVGAQPAAPQPPIDFKQLGIPDTNAQELRKLQNDLMLPALNQSQRAVLLERFKAKLKESEMTPDRKNWISAVSDAIAMGKNPIEEVGLFNDFLKNKDKESAYDKQSAEGLFKTYADIATKGRKAEDKMSTLNAMESIVDNPKFTSGFGAEGVMAAGQFGAMLDSGLRRLGVNTGDTLKGLKDTTALMEQFGALSSKSVLDSLGGSLGNQVSNSDRDFMKGTTENLGFSVQGNKALILMHRKLAQREQDAAEWAIEYRERTPKNKQTDYGLDRYIKEKVKAAGSLFSKEEMAGIQAEAERVRQMKEGPKTETSQAKDPAIGKVIIGPNNERLIYQGMDARGRPIFEPEKKPPSVVRNPPLQINPRQLLTPPEQDIEGGMIQP